MASYLEIKQVLKEILSLDIRGIGTTQGIGNRPYQGNLFAYVN